jgi:hypothetical protein
MIQIFLESSTTHKANILAKSNWKWHGQPLSKLSTPYLHLTTYQLEAIFRVREHSLRDDDDVPELLPMDDDERTLDEMWEDYYDDVPDLISDNI